MSWRDMPAPSGPEAVDAVFEMAAEIIGSLPPEAAEPYEEWLGEVRDRLMTKTSDRERTPHDVLKLRRKLATMGHPINGRDACSLCGELGHKKTTCPQASWRKR